MSLFGCAKRQMVSPNLRPDARNIRLSQNRLMRRSNGRHRNDVLYYLMRPELVSHPWPQSHGLQQIGAA
jgi:hypothetical protein